MNRYDYADPSTDSDRCDALSIDPDDERAAEAAEIAEHADLAEARAAERREYPIFRKGAA